MFTQKCQAFFEQKYGFKKALLTTSCTDALEMCAILANIQPGDEVIIPSFTFVSTALAFVRQGAKIVFADSSPNHPNIDVSKLEALITPKTKAIVPVHYAGVACDMDEIMRLSEKYNLIIIEDAAQAIDSYYKGKALGSIGHMGAFSFHETKNIIAGEGGMLTINDAKFIPRAEIIWEKGTNRAAFFRGEIDKYTWVDTGSSFLPSEVIAAFLWAQIEKLEDIQKKRLQMWNCYYENLKDWAKNNEIELPEIPDFASNNSHMFYLVCPSEVHRSRLIRYLKDNNILAIFHYQSLHSSPYYSNKYDGSLLPNADSFSEKLVRLPMFYELDVEKVISAILLFHDKVADSL
ncbi:4-keto-6-deoxy-N-Acetyl-D-hexosaminyl-(Lipid carrier) aminotransferase [Flavobacterium enshiense DK69]|nr:4-keto-6-deoxy-N-Acetyl-D-hexosaminyl-(Lipid carrier) aminotransferase [Flavobacterium enshiense DK69]